MLDAGSLRTFSDGVLLGQQGDATQEFYQIVSGRNRQFMLTAEGGEVLIYLYRPGDVVGDSAAVDDAPYPVSIAAQGAVTARVWSLRGFAGLRVLYPEIETALARQMARRLRGVLTRVQDLSTLPVPARIASRLLYLMTMTGSSRLELSQADLALTAGTSRQTANGVLHKLRKSGLIEHCYGRITIRDPSGLERFKAQFTL